MRLTPAEVLVRNDGYSQKYSVASRGGGTGLEGLRERAASEGDVNWGSEGSTWELRLAFKGEAL